MDKRSKYRELKWVVECRRPPNPSTWWESICAFNSDRVALEYAKKCSTPARLIEGWRYRVVTRKGNEWRVVTKPEW